MRRAYVYGLASMLIASIPTIVFGQSAEQNSSIIISAPADLTPADQKAITEVLNKGFSFGGGVSLPFVGGGGFQIEIKSATDAGEGALKMDTTKSAGLEPDVVIKNWLCEAACDVASATAGAACTGLSGGVAVAACVAAVAATRDECKRRC